MPECSIRLLGKQKLLIFLRKDAEFEEVGMRFGRGRRCPLLVERVLRSADAGTPPSTSNCYFVISIKLSFSRLPARALPHRNNCASSMRRDFPQDPTSPQLIAGYLQPTFGQSSCRGRLEHSGLEAALRLWRS